ncbi:MAG: GNAT family N-acetyltransferase, partial [Actinomycetota bacterium]|nr:GNAT family N-acetyltransferase [Actinomycetota bacterium]
AQGSGLLWVALGSEGDPVGFALASICGRRVHLDEIDVLPEHGRKGVGSALVKAVENWALHSDCMGITLTTFRDVPWNAPFYAHIGFVVIPEGELDEYLLRRLSDESAMGLERSRRVAMCKSLGRPSAST